MQQDSAYVVTWSFIYDDVLQTMVIWAWEMLDTYTPSTQQLSPPTTLFLLDSRQMK